MGAKHYAGIALVAILAVAIATRVSFLKTTVLGLQAGS